MILSAQPHPHTVRLAKLAAALWEIYGLEMNLCVRTEEQEKSFYVTQSSIIIKASLLNDRRIMFSRAMIL